MSARRAGVSIALALVAGSALPRGAEAQELPVRVRADEVGFDPRSQALDARGNVRIDVPPFYLTSDQVSLRRSSLGVIMDGDGRLGFCPCLGTPLAVSFNGATVAPPFDVILRQPKLEVFGLPVLWAPAFWLRSPARPGILAPDIAYRGSDGIFVGGGVHVPWISGTPRQGFDLRAGAYLRGGVAVDAMLYTDESLTHVRWDRLVQDGLTVDARGATAMGRRDADLDAPAEIAWDVDAIRGARGVAATTDIEAAAMPFDHASAEAAWRDGGWTLSSGVRSIAPRGGDVLDLGAVGPIVGARRADALSDAGAYDIAIEGGALRSPASAPLTFARADGGALLATRFAPFGASLALRAIGDVASDGEARGIDVAASARARIALPLVRGFTSRDPDDPWVHRVEPRVEVAALGLQNGGVLGRVFGRGAAGIAPGAAWTADAGLANTIGRWGDATAADVDVAAGGIGDASGATGAIRERATLTAAWGRLSGEAAQVLIPGLIGHAFAARARIGRADSLALTANAAAREGIDPLRARALTDGPLEPSSGFLSASGVTGGARVVVPWTRAIMTTAGADGDLTSGRLVAAIGSVELRDACRCIIVRATGARRIGRDGVDIWLTVDLPEAP